MGNAQVEHPKKDIKVITSKIRINSKTGQSILKNLFGKLDFFNTKEIEIEIKNPQKNIHIKAKILNREKLEDVLYDFISDVYMNQIITLNGYELSLEKTLYENNVQNGDVLFSSDTLTFFFVLGDQKFPISSSKYQKFIDVYTKFKNFHCPEEYKDKIEYALFNEKKISKNALIKQINIKERNEVILALKQYDSCECLYDEGAKALERFNFVHFKKNSEKINENDIKIEINHNDLDSSEIKELTKIDFRNLKILCLTNCKINCINFLEYETFVNLTEINLQQNKLTNLNINNLFLPQLKLLNVSRNEIKEIITLSQTNIDLPQLILLSLSNNFIKDISPLGLFKMPMLSELYLNNNEIESIDIFSNVSFFRLKKIDLNNNKINDITVLSHLSFAKNIEEINLMNNEIINLNILRDVSLPELSKLNLLNNDISDYSAFQLVFLPKLQYLYMFPNKLDPNNFDNSSEIYVNFISSCENILNKGVQIEHFYND